MLRVLLMIAQKMITVNWLTPLAVSQWTQRLKNVYAMENMTTRLQLKMATFLSNSHQIVPCPIIV